MVALLKFAWLLHLENGLDTSNVCNRMPSGAVSTVVKNLRAPVWWNFSTTFGLTVALHLLEGASGLIFF